MTHEQISKKRAHLHLLHFCTFMRRTVRAARRMVIVRFVILTLANLNLMYFVVIFIVSFQLWHHAEQDIFYLIIITVIVLHILTESITFRKLYASEKDVFCSIFANRLLLLVNDIRLFRFSVRWKLIDSLIDC